MRYYLFLYIQLLKDTIVTTYYKHETYGAHEITAKIRSGYIFTVHESALKVNKFSKNKNKKYKIY